MPGEARASLRALPPLTVIDLRGEVTTFAEEVVTGAYRQASEQGARHILLNFAEVDYINSAGIAAIIGILTEARRAEQSLMITGLTPHYAKIFQMTGLDQFAPLFDSEAAARESVAS
jgi:anti-anti-sigma factor